MGLTQSRQIVLTVVAFLAGMLAMAVTAPLTGPLAFFIGIAAGVFAYKKCKALAWFNAAPKRPALPSFASSAEMIAHLTADWSREESFNCPYSVAYPLDLATAMSITKQVISSYTLTVGPNVYRFSLLNLDQNEGSMQAQISFQQHVGAITDPNALQSSSVIVTVRFYPFPEGTVVEQSYQMATGFNIGTPRSIISQMKAELAHALSRV